MEKLIQLIKKLLGQSSGSDSSENKGFTLIELLIVIAIIGILAAGLLVAINPADKIRQANDTSAIQKITQTASRIDQWVLNTGEGGVTGTIPASQANAYSAVGALTDGNGYVYSYLPDTTNNWYVLRVTGLKSTKAKLNAGDGAATSVNFVYTSQNGKSCYALNSVTVNAAYQCP